MKFMKLGSKPDSFQTDGNVRFVVTDLATDIAVNVGEVKFKLHKFPLLSKSGRLHKLIATTDENGASEIHIPDIPGGASAFEVCAKFCYGITVTLNAYNVVAARCAAEYLEMNETVEKGNLIYKIDVFLASSIFRSWKDSIIVLKTTKSVSTWCEDLKIVGRCIDSIVSRASIDPSNVDWSYTYNRKKIPSENGVDPEYNGGKKHQSVPKDWWVEDLCELDIDCYKRVIRGIKTKGKISSDIIGEALCAYASRNIPGFVKGVIQGGDIAKCRLLVERLVWLLPTEVGSMSCSFLLKLLKAANLIDCVELVKKELVKRISQQLEEASVIDLLIPAQRGEDKSVKFDVDVVQSIVAECLTREQSDQENMTSVGELQEIRIPVSLSGTAKVAVAKLVDGYLAEVSRDPNLPLSKFIDLAETVPSDSRPVHDGLYRAIDMYLKEHPGLSKGEKKKICKLMDSRKLSMEACIHAAQNDRLPLRVIVQVLFFEQVRATGTANGDGPDLPGNIRAFLPKENSESHGSSMSGTTNTEDDWEATGAFEVNKSIKGELASMKLVGGKNEFNVKNNGGGGNKSKGI